MNTSAVIPFSFETQDVRAVTVDGEPWFVAKDVCDILELEQVTRALSCLDEDELTLLKLRSGGQDREMNCISESGLYTLVIRSNKPQAKLFRKWVTSVVLPSIRKTGEYVAPEFEGNKYSVYRHHHRTTTAPKGLDIRYTLDLTKIILRPTKNSLALLQRLTGVDVSDLAERAVDLRPGNERADSLKAFIDTHTESLPGVRLQMLTIFRAYRSWCAEAQLPSSKVATIQDLGAYLRTRGCEVDKRGGKTWVLGLAVAQEVAA